MAGSFLRRMRRFTVSSETDKYSATSGTQSTGAKRWYSRAPGEAISWGRYVASRGSSSHRATRYWARSRCAEGSASKGQSISRIQRRTVHSEMLNIAATADKGTYVGYMSGLGCYSKRATLRVQGAFCKIFFLKVGGFCNGTFFECRKCQLRNGRL